MDWGDDGVGTDEEEDEGIQIKPKEPEKQTSAEENSSSKNGTYKCFSLIPIYVFNNICNIYILRICDKEHNIIAKI